MNNSQIKWAMQHDWFSHVNGDVVYVVDSGVRFFQDSEGKERKEEFSNLVAFSEFQELKDWAGY